MRTGIAWRILVAIPEPVVSIIVSVAGPGLAAATRSIFLARATTVTRPALLTVPAAATRSAILTGSITGPALITSGVIAIGPITGPGPGARPTRDVAIGPFRSVAPAVASVIILVLGATVIFGRRIVSDLDVVPAVFYLSVSPLIVLPGVEGCHDDGVSIEVVGGIVGHIGDPGNDLTSHDKRQNHRQEDERHHVHGHGTAFIPKKLFDRAHNSNRSAQKEVLQMKHMTVFGSNLGRGVSNCGLCRLPLRMTSGPVLPKTPVFRTCRAAYRKPARFPLIPCRNRL